MTTDATGTPVPEPDPLDPLGDGDTDHNPTDPAFNPPPAPRPDFAGTPQDDIHEVPPELAQGGIITNPGPILVGEQGPETVELPGGTVEQP